jgi:hypothetical protein
MLRIGHGSVRKRLGGHRELEGTLKNRLRGGAGAQQEGIEDVE